MTLVLARIVRAFALWCLLAAFPAEGCALCQTTSDCVGAIQTAYRDLSTFTASMVQTKHLSLLDEPLVSKGRLAFKRPDSLLLQIESPRPLRIVMNGPRISIPELGPEANAALESAPASALSRLHSIFTGDIATLQESFDVKASENDAGITVALEPRDPQMFNTIRTMELRFERPDLLLRTIRISNALGDALEIALSDVQRNPVLPDLTFAIGDSRS